LVIKTLDPDPDSLEMLDPDPDLMNPEPHLTLFEKLWTRKPENSKTFSEEI
jgi:hypothetical protein